MDMFYAFAVLCQLNGPCILTRPQNKFPTAQACEVKADALQQEFKVPPYLDILNGGGARLYKGCVVRPDDWNGDTATDVLKELQAKAASEKSL